MGVTNVKKPLIVIKLYELRTENIIIVVWVRRVLV